MENKLKIGIDIDEVVVEYVKQFLEFYKIKTGREIPIESIYCFRMEECLGIPKEELIKFAKGANESGFLEKQKFTQGAKSAVKRLSKDNEIFFITSRPLYLKKRTSKFLKKNLGDLEYKEIFCRDCPAGSGSKYQICSDLGISILIEDRRKYALECAQNGIKVLLMDKPWNRENCEHENIIRVKNWKEILERIKMLSEKSEIKNFSCFPHENL